MSKEKAVFDSEYFRTTLQASVTAMGGSAVVELHLLNGQTHRLQSVLSMHSGYVTLEAYQTRGDEATRKPRWKEEAVEGDAPHETQQLVVAYESIVSVALMVARADGAPKIGFSRK